MKKSYLINLILVGLIIGLYWFNTVDTDPVAGLKQLSPLTSDDIQHIIISRPNTADIILEKSASGWHITQPIKAIANNTRVELLLSFLNTPSYAQISAVTDGDLEQFELAPANLVLTLNQFNVQFGGIEAISKHRYVLIGDVIHLITDRITPLLYANASSFIENRLIAKNNIITKLVLPKLNTDNTLSAESTIIENLNGHWQSNLPAITTDQITAIVQNWQYAYALQVLPIKDTMPATSMPHKVQVWFNNQILPAEYDLTINGNALFIKDPQQMLNYQFTLALLTQLLPSQPSEQ
jgi:hypothetical protein